MSDEEDFEEFPSISVNSSIHESSSFSMPSAEELATQRAREAECESALLRLREEHDRADRECARVVRVAPGASVSAVTHSDSSGSEGEAALAAAVRALQVEASAPHARRALAPCSLLRAHGSADALLAAYERAVHAHGARALMDEMTSSISEMVLEAATSEDVQVWPSEEILGITAWLCVALCAPSPPRCPPGIGGVGSRGHGALLRTLHLLIEDVATDDQMEALRGLVVACAGEGAVALQLCDALWGAGAARGDALATALAHTALAHLAGCTPDQDVSMDAIGEALCGAGGAAWRRLSPGQQYVALQLVARLLSRSDARAGPREREGRSLLAALAQVTPSQRAHSTDQLKVVVAASKLQVLFHGTS